LRSPSLRSPARAGIAQYVVPTFAVVAISAALAMAGDAARAQAPPSTPSTPAAPAVARRSGSGAGDENRRQQQFARFLIARSRNAATAKIGGAEVMAHVGKLTTDSDDYRALAELAPGAVLELPGAAACKLRNEIGLRFGGTASQVAVLPTGNASPGYAGLYSFWLRAPAEGSASWSLVFNDEADVWGTQRDPARDRVEVPVEHDQAGVEAKELAVAIEAAASGDAGVLEVRWGTHRWRAAFTASP